VPIGLHIAHNQKNREVSKKMSKDSKLYQLLESFTMETEDSTYKPNRFNKKNNFHNNPPPSPPQKCNNQCIDCSLVFCRK